MRAPVALKFLLAFFAGFFGVVGLVEDGDVVVPVLGLLLAAAFAVDGARDLRRGPR